jgi:hypothetical protein
MQLGHCPGRRSRRGKLLDGPVRGANQERRSLKTNLMAAALVTVRCDAKKILVGRYVGAATDREPVVAGRYVGAATERERVVASPEARRSGSGAISFALPVGRGSDFAARGITLDWRRSLSVAASFSDA